MPNKLVIIVPGLGDENSLNRIRKLLKFWAKDRRVLFFDARWSSSEAYDCKQKRLTDLIKSHEKSLLSVVAYSAGGALAVSCTDSKNINKIILISSKLKRPEGIGPSYQKAAPALKRAVEASGKITAKLSPEQKSKIICLVPIYDGVVAKEDMVIDGTKRKLIPFLGHAGSIGFALLFQVRSIT